MRGEPLDVLSRELQVGAAQLSQWRETFLAAGCQGLSSRPGQDEAEVIRLNAKIGELTMANELLNQKIDHMEQGRPLARRRSIEMSRTTSPSSDKNYGLARVCKIWKLARSTVYWRKKHTPSLARRGPHPWHSDLELLTAIRTFIAESEFFGEGYEKFTRL